MNILILEHLWVSKIDKPRVNYKIMGREIVGLLMKTITVLILDDVPYVRHLIADEISAIGGVNQIYEAGNAIGAISILLENHPNLIILDINVPGGILDGNHFSNGIDVLRLAKEKLPDSIIIMLSNNSNDYYRRECAKVGADFFFDKTNEFDLFLNQVQQLIPSS